MSFNCNNRSFCGPNLGHYTATHVFGFQAPPGVSVQIQVVQVRVS